MTATRIYLPVILSKGDKCHTTVDQSRYLGAVLRMREGGRVIVFNGTGSEYETVLRGYFEDGAELEVVEKKDVPFAGVRVALCQAIPKAQKMEGIIRHATELGVNRIVPFIAARSIPHWDSSFAHHKEKPGVEKTNRSHGKLERWRKIAVEACRQSGRADIPEISNIFNFPDMLSHFSEGGPRLIFWEEETDFSLRDVIAEVRAPNGTPKGAPHPMITLAIGPEGGFSAEEIDLARRAGFVSVSLGDRVLRVETASLAAIAIIQYELNQKQVSRD